MKSMEKHQWGHLFSRRKMMAATGTLIGGILLPSGIDPASAKGTDGGDAGMIFSVRSYGATGQRAQQATDPFLKAIEACAGAGGGVVYVPPGDYTVGRIRLRDNITLYIEAGATLYLSQLKADFDHGPRTMIYAENSSKVSVTGKGVLNGLAAYDYLEMKGIDPEISGEIEIARQAGADMRRYYRKSTAMNTFMFVINQCTDFTLEGITVLNSPLWNVRLSDCDRVSISGVYIYSDVEKGVNADGIDLCSCRNVSISDSKITTGDDAIIIKSISRNGNKANPSENITVTNCILESSSTALGIGTETEADIKNVVFSNCVIKHSNKGFGINVQDGATVSNIIFSNLTIELNRRHWNWWGSAEMCRIVLKKRRPGSRLGVIKDVVISNIIAHPRGTSTLIGHPEQPLENITIDNVQLLMETEDAPDKRATDALRIEGVKGLKIRDLTVSWPREQTEPKWQSALVLENVSDVILDSFTGRQGLMKSTYPALVLDNVSGGLIRDACAPEGTATFIRVQGDQTKEIIIRDNTFFKAEKDIDFENRDVREQVKMHSNI
jgi:hypothetical protein